jgi:DNA gyrase subunit A
MQSHFIAMGTRQGQLKKTALSAFGRPRSDGIIAIKIGEGDELLEARLTDGSMHIILASSGGRAIRFHEDDARPIGRNTMGVRGMRLGPEEQVVGMIIVDRDDTDVLSVSAHGYGKRTGVNQYPIQKRGGRGVITQKATDRVGGLVSVRAVHETDGLMIITQRGIMIRMNVGGISRMGRNTQGVRLISLSEGDSIADVTRVLANGVDEPGRDVEDGDE